MTNERELPPLRVKLLGDSSSYDKMVVHAINEAQRLSDAVKSLASNAVSASGSSKQMKTLLKDLVSIIEGRLMQTSRELVSDIQSVKASATPMKQLMTRIVDTIGQYLEWYTKKLVETIDSVKAKSKPMKDLMTFIVSSILDYLQDYSKQLVSTIDTVRAAPTPMRTLMTFIVRSIRDYLEHYAKQLVSTIDTVRASPRQVTALMRYVVSTIREYILHYIRQLVNGVGSIRATPGRVRQEVRDAIRTALQTIMQAIRRTMISVDAQMSQQPMFVPTVRAALRRVVRNALLALVTNLEAAIMAAVNTINVNVVPAMNRLQRGVNSALRNMTLNAQRQMQQQGAGPGPGPGGGAGRAGGGGANGGILQGLAGLGSRGDVYMHVNAMQALLSSGKGIMDLYSGFTQATASIEVFAGSADKARDIMADLTKYAQQTPYSIQEMADEARNLMGRGMAPDKAVDSLKQLSVVAGGNTERLSHLAYAFSQISTKGYLMQQDLNQLAEQGFNPLRLIAERTMKANQTLEQRMAEVTEAKEKHLITSKHVEEILKAETSAGGKYAELLKRMSGEVGGLANRLKEMFAEFKIRVMQVFDEELKNMLKTAIHYVGMAKDFVLSNKDMMLQILGVAKTVLTAAVAFHSIALVVAIAKWQIASFASTARVLIIPVVLAFRSLMAVFSAMQVVGTVAFAALSAGMAASMAVARMHNAVTMAMWTGMRMAAAGVWAVFAAFQALRAMSLYSMLMNAAFAASQLWASMSLTAMWTGITAGAMRAWNAVMATARAGMVAFQLISVAAWAAFLGPISLIVGLIGLIIAAIWNAVEAIGGEGGFTGAFSRAWEAMKWFFSASYGFFSNFSHNMGVIAKYLYNNWYSLFTDMLAIVVGFVSAVPNNLLTMWRMGMRLTVAFGAWLISYLPSAIYNAFVAGFNFVKGMFQKLLDAGKAVWKFITTPSQWKEGATSVSNFIAQLGADAKSVNENGFMETAKNIIDEERKNLTTGMEKVDLTSPALEGLKLDIPTPEKPPEPEAPPVPEAYTPDLSGIEVMAEDKKKKGKKGPQLVDTAAYRSSEHAKRVYSYMQNMEGIQAGLKGEPKKEDLQKQQLKALQGIEKNTRPAAGPQPANLSPT